MIVRRIIRIHSILLVVRINQILNAPVTVEGLGEQAIIITQIKIELMRNSLVIHIIVSHIFLTIFAKLLSILAGYRRNDGVSRGGYRGRDNHQNPVSMNAFIEKPSGSFNSIRNHQAEQEPFVEPENYPEPERLNGSITFVISHFESATQFYAQNKSSESGLNSLSVKLQKERLNWPPFMLDSGKVNQPCLALDEDSCWYRGKAENIIFS